MIKPWHYKVKISAINQNVFYRVLNHPDMLITMCFTCLIRLNFVLNVFEAFSPYRFHPFT